MRNYTITFAHRLIDPKTGSSADWRLMDIQYNRSDVINIVLEKAKTGEVRQITIGVNEAINKGFINLNALNPFCQKI